MTLKSVFLLDYFLHSTSGFSMMMKTDDDSFLNIQKIMKELVPYLETKRDFIAGKIVFYGI